MTESDKQQVYDWLKQSEKIAVLTGAGVSVPSGIPDYRSLAGVYQGVAQPEYLLSAECLMTEPERFYAFVKHLYHPQAKPNVIHQTLVQMDQEHQLTVITQNIDGLHQAAGSRHVIPFHGSLYDCYCLKCGQTVGYADYLNSDQHANCGGRIRPKIVLYGEGLDEQLIEQAIMAISQADLLIIIGTSLKVAPFNQLVYYRQKTTKVVAINQEPIDMMGIDQMVEEDAALFFTDWQRSRGIC